MHITLLIHTFHNLNIFLRYVRSANNSQSRSRERSAIRQLNIYISTTRAMSTNSNVSRQEQEQELSEPDQDMEETLEGDQGEEAAVGYERSI